MTDTKAALQVRKPRGEYAKTGAKREAILDAALEVFSESGYRAGSLKEIALRVGMSEPGLLHHFKNKGELLAAVLDRRDERALEIIDFDAPDSTETLRGLRRLAEYNVSTPGVVELFCVLSAEATSPQHPAHDYFVQRYEYSRDQFSAAFRRLADEGRLLAGVDPLRAAVATLALMDGLQVQWLLNREAVDMPGSLHEFLGGLVHGYDVEPADAAEIDVSADGAEGVDSGAGA